MYSICYTRALSLIICSPNLNPNVDIKAHLFVEIMVKYVMKNMAKELTLAKWVLIIQPKIPQMTQNLSAQFVGPSTKVMDIKEKKASLSVCSPWMNPYTDYGRPVRKLPSLHYQSQIFRYARSMFCLPHRPKLSDLFDLCLHLVSVVRDPIVGVCTN